jgi:N-formylglutamate deformylase
MNGWLRVRPGSAPLVLSLPHTGTEIPPAIGQQLADPWLARKDADWWIDRLYDFAEELDATIVHTAISRTVIDVNRDPSGASLYPGQATTGLCPVTTFDGEPLYRDAEPDEVEIAGRRETYFAPYHAALASEIERMRGMHARVVLYDCHSIRSRIPRLFEGTLPAINIGTNSGASCNPALCRQIETIAAASRFDHVVNGRFKGGWITRHYGMPERGVHAVQMELACRSYMREPDGAADRTDWPSAYDPAFAAPMRETLRQILTACLNFARAENL